MAVDNFYDTMDEDEGRAGGSEAGLRGGRSVECEEVLPHQRPGWPGQAVSEADRGQGETVCQVILA